MAGHSLDRNGACMYTCVCECVCVCHGEECILCKCVSVCVCICHGRSVFSVWVCVRARTFDAHLWQHGEIIGKDLDSMLFLYH